MSIFLSTLLIVTGQLLVGTAGLSAVAILARRAGILERGGSRVRRGRARRDGAARALRRGTVRMAMATAVVSIVGASVGYEPVIGPLLPLPGALLICLGAGGASGAWLLVAAVRLEAKGRAAVARSWSAHAGRLLLVFELLLAAVLLAARFLPPPAGPAAGNDLPHPGSRATLGAALAFAAAGWIGGLAGLSGKPRSGAALTAALHVLGVALLHGI